MVSRRVGLGIAIGVSVVLTGALFLGMRIIPFESIRNSIFKQTGIWLWSNPVQNIFIGVGLLGGAIAGYVSEPRWQAGAVDGFWTGLLTGIGVYLLFVFYNFSLALLEGGAVAFYVILTVPLIHVLPILFAFPLEGILTGMVVAWFRDS